MPESKANNDSISEAHLPRDQFIQQVNDAVSQEGTRFVSTKNPNGPEHSDIVLLRGVKGVTHDQGIKFSGLVESGQVGASRTDRIRMMIGDGVSVADLRVSQNEIKGTIGRWKDPENWARVLEEFNAVGGNVDVGDLVFRFPNSDGCFYLIPHPDSGDLDFITTLLKQSSHDPDLTQAAVDWWAEHQNQPDSAGDTQSAVANTDIVPPVDTSSEPPEPVAEQVSPAIQELRNAVNRWLDRHGSEWRIPPLGTETPDEVLKLARDVFSQFGGVAINNLNSNDLEFSLFFNFNAHLPGDVDVNGSRITLIAESEAKHALGGKFALLQKEIDSIMKQLRKVTFGNEQIAYAIEGSTQPAVYLGEKLYMATNSLAQWDLMKDTPVIVAGFEGSQDVDRPIWVINDRSGIQADYITRPVAAADLHLPKTPAPPREPQIAVATLPNQSLVHLLSLSNGSDRPRIVAVEEPGHFPLVLGRVDSDHIVLILQDGMNEKPEAIFDVHVTRFTEKDGDIFADISFLQTSKDSVKLKLQSQRIPVSKILTNQS